jgi:glucokinase
MADLSLVISRPGQSGQSRKSRGLECDDPDATDRTERRWYYGCQSVSRCHGGWMAMSLLTLPDPGTPAASWTAGMLLQVVREQSPLTRAEIIERTGLGRSTVGLRLDELRAAGLVDVESAGPSTGGRPPMTLGLNPKVWLVAGMDLGARHITVGIADITGSVLGTVTRPGPASRDPIETLNEAVDMLDELLTRCGRPRSVLLAMSVGLAGSVEHASGRTRRPVLVPAWEGFDVRGWLQDAAGIPTQVDNDVNVMAVGERIANWPEVEDLVFVKASTGIGGGIISGGRLQRGSLGAAGDLGHIEVPGAADVICACGSRGCLEAVASVPALMRRLSGRAKTADELIELLGAADPAATTLARDAGRSVGAVLAGVVSLLNPSVVVLGGRLADAGEPFLAGVREVVYGRGMPLSTDRLRIVRSELRSLAGVTGAVHLALEEALSPAAIDRLVASGRATSALRTA